MQHFTKSSYREMILEALFLGKLLSYLWEQGAPIAEVLHIQRDHAGYDLVIDCNSRLRYIQLKGMVAPWQVRLNTQLASKPGACVVGLVIDSKSLQIKHYRWFDCAPDENGKSRLEGCKPAKSLLFNRNGERAVLKNTKIIPASESEKLNDIGCLVDRLFGWTPEQTNLNQAPDKSLT